MSEHDLILSMQMLREKIISSHSKLQTELRVNNLLRLLELGLISKETLDLELSNMENYKELVCKKNIKAKIR